MEWIKLKLKLKLAMRTATKSIDLILSQKTNWHVQHTFLYFSLPLFCSTTMLFCMAKGDVTREDQQQRFLVQHSVPTLMQHCCDIVSNSYNIVPTLQRCVALKLVFSLSKSEWPCDIPPKTPWVACDIISVNWVILHWYACDADGRPDGRTVTWLPKKGLSNKVVLHETICNDDF